ncbi:MULTISPECIES: hypothetical protein [unclassified Streptomyces]|uniref:hypothetical protein n=1 Tax=unclassified Streptomyces TaxID=2593676 RepID=UPI002E2C4E98|nr:hypothetical protein [Streptomyces sp. NBC_00334]
MQKLLPTLTDVDLRRRPNPPRPTTPGDGRGDGRGEDQDSALRTTVLYTDVLGAMTEHDLKKALVYCNLVSDARRFIRELPHTLHLLAKTDPHLTPDAAPAPPPTARSSLVYSP